ncbi:MAG: sigma 54-interacting transcriptional regulator [Desulfobacterales bacterium]|nr:sigma 54-interacting transcriptional regulator [Desulfobacterales bacterium]
MMQDKQTESKTIIFKCDHCSQEYTFEILRIAIFLHGVILLIGKEYGVIGITCTRCNNTTLKRKDKNNFNDIIDKIKGKLYLINYFGDVSGKIFNKIALLNEKEKEKFKMESYKFTEKKLGELKYTCLFQEIPDGKLIRSNISQLFSGYYQNEYWHSFNDGKGIYKKEIKRHINPNALKIYENFLNSYIPNTIARIYEKNFLNSYIPNTIVTNTFIFEPNTVVLHYDENQIEQISIIENKSRIKIVPRYYYYNDMIEHCESYYNFCYKIDYYNKEEFTCNQKKIMEQNLFYMNILENLFRYNNLFKEINELFKIKNVLNYIDDEKSKKFEGEIFTEKMLFKIWDKFTKDYLQKYLSTKSFELAVEYKQEFQRIDYTYFNLWNLIKKHFKDVYNEVEKFDTIQKSASTQEEHSEVIPEQSETIQEEPEVIPEQSETIQNKCPKAILNESMSIQDNYDFKIISEDIEILKNIIKLPTYVSPQKKDINILLIGETGTGKELFANACHKVSERKRSFVVVDCTAIPEHLFESELFGHIKGSFTGAINSKEGLFKSADGGTIFLDEIGKLKLDLQAKLLRVIQEREIQRIGETKYEHIDVMVVMATNTDLNRSIEDGSFLKDLYYRITELYISIPPLRDRKHDIPLLVDHFIEEKDHERLIDKSLPVFKFQKESIDFLQSCEWKGNIRELSGLVNRVLNNRINEKNRSPIEVSDIKKAFIPEITSQQQSQKNKHKKDLSDQNVLKALHKYEGCREEAATELEISTRTLLRRIKKIEAKGINVPLPADGRSRKSKV